LGNLSTPKSVQKLQTALHAKAKAEAGYRFYALYDKISREDILAHAYAQCRSNRAHRGLCRSAVRDDVFRTATDAKNANRVRRWHRSRHHGLRAAGAFSSAQTLGDVIISIAHADRA
jgi:hypothetical protein